MLVLVSDSKRDVIVVVWGREGDETSLPARDRAPACRMRRGIAAPLPTAHICPETRGERFRGCELGR
eukprot:2826864-Rhodomonas_salina.7